MTIQAKVTTPADDSPPLHSRAVVVLTGLSYLFTGLGFSFLDRRFGSFGLEGFLWLVWAVLGFGAGALHVGRPASAGKTQWLVLGALGGLLALFPGFAIYNLLRWTSLTLMIVIGARAAVLKTRRDFYFTLIVIFVVGFMVGTHGNADWTLWFYLGPAWVFGGLALAWDHAAGTPLSRWTKMFMTLGFISASFLLAVALFFFAPRPPVLGFGFLPPGTDTPGMFTQPAGSGGQQGKGGSDGASGSGGNAGQGNAGAPQQGGWGQQWDAMLQGMRRAASDKTIPQWQRGIMEKTLDWAQTLHGLLTGRAFKPAGDPVQMDAPPQPLEQEEMFSFRVNWLLVLALLLLGYLLWRRRYRLGLQVVLGGAWLLSGRYPAQSMRLSAQAMKWCLHMQGHTRRPGQSVREHWVAAAGVAPLARRWLGYAVESYCAMRFGNVPATPQQAIHMRQAVMGACDIMLGTVPELAR
jgi:hypothetical protein